jgi:transcriptional regulator with PAS, ATPase and Fis domain
MAIGSGRGICPAINQQTDAEFGTNDNLANAVELYEKSHIERTLGKTGGDKIRAAGMLRLSLATLYRKIEKLEIKD